MYQSAGMKVFVAMNLAAEKLAPLASNVTAAKVNGGKFWFVKICFEAQSTPGIRTFPTLAIRPLSPGPST